MKSKVFLKPILSFENRPLWSVMIPTYNCAQYATETLQSVLQQDMGEALMQIEVIDDCSTDDIERVVQEIGKGRVGFFRQSKNVGHIRNFETALEHSRGHFIHLLHGDDRVLYGFYKQMGALMQTHPHAGAAFCRHYFIDAHGHQHYISPLLQNESGIMTDFFSFEAVENVVQTPSIVVRRQVYEKLGMFDHRLMHSEDWEMWVRIAAAYPVVYCHKPLAEYRNYDNSHTMRSASHPKAWEAQLLVMKLIETHAANRLPGLQKKHLQYLAKIGWYNIRSFYNTGKRKQALALLGKLLLEPLTIRNKIKLIKIAISGEWKMRTKTAKNRKR